jgi:hypothetical protein
MADTDEPEWLLRLRSAAHQRPRTQFQRVRWADLQQLLRQRDYLLAHADDDSKAYIALLAHEDYGRGPRP